MKGINKRKMNMNKQLIKKKENELKNKAIEQGIRPKSNWSNQGFNEFDRVLILLVEQSYKEADKRKNVGNWSYMKNLSNEHSAVFLQPQSKELVYAIKGTSSKKELLLDLKLALNSFNLDRTQLLRTLLHFEKIKEAYNDYRIIITSHSLGGIKAMNISKKYPNIVGTTFNTFFPAITAPGGELFNLLINNTKLKKVIVRGDPLSNFITSYSKSFIELNPGFLKQNIMAHLVSTLKKL